MSPAYWTAKREDDEENVLLLDRVREWNAQKNETGERPISRADRGALINRTIDSKLMIEELI